MFSTAGQAVIFLTSIYAGLLTGLLYDLLTWVRRLFRVGAFATGVLDFIFWLAAAVALVLCVGLSGGDGLRGYMLMGFAAGALLYAAGVRALTAALWNLLSRAARTLAAGWADWKKKVSTVSGEEGKP